MGKIQAEIKTSFGKIIVEGSNIEDFLATLKTIPEDFLSKVESIITSNMPPKRKIEEEGIIQFTKEGPILVCETRITHYEAIGLTLYFSNGKTNTTSQICRLLEHTGIRPRVSSRLSEMAERGLIFKPNLGGADWRLTSKGEKWIEENVLSRLKKKG